MGEKELRQILDLLKRIQRSLTIIQVLAAITLGFLLAVSFAKVF
jgi:hypothetical protein